MGNPEPKRVFVSVSSKSPYWPKSWTSSEEVIGAALRLVMEEGLIEPGIHDASSEWLFMAKERWNTKIFIVFDMFNDTYNAENAHLPGQNDLTVISVYLGKNESASIAG